MKKLRAIVRVRESVAATQLPELERGRDSKKRKPVVLKLQPPGAKASKKGSGKRSKKRKPKVAAARESVRFVALLREADIRKAGNAYEATIVREGPGNPEDRNYYSREALRRAVSDGLFEGLQAYADHPTPTEERERPERSVRQLVGHFREARYVEDGGRAVVRAKFIPVSGAGYEWVTSLIESALKAPAGKPLVGISIDGYGHAPDTEEIGGRTYSVVREITHLGSADIVTRAGAGGQFHRRLSESLAGARASVSAAPELSAGKLQARVRKALQRLEEGLADEDEDKARDAFVALHEAAGATVKTPSPKPSARRSAEVSKLEAQLRKADKRRRLAESRADLADRAKLAARLLREVDVPTATREQWWDELAEQKDETAMRALLERRQTERREQLAELRESLGLGAVEGAGRREPSGIPSAPAGGGLLERLGIDRDELEAA